MKLTLKEAKQYLANRGMTIRSRDGEYRVNYKGGSEETAYYTNDLRDACESGRELAQWRDSHLGEKTLNY